LQTVENLRLHIEESDVISFLKEAFPRKFPSINIIPTNETEIKSNTFPQSKKFFML
jgi:hypothetical protein